MGKNSKVISGDPILSKNFKYEKRTKNKLIQKAKQEEQKVLQLKRKKQMIDVESKVDRQIQKITANLQALTKHNQIAKLKSQIFHQQARKEKETTRLPSCSIQLQLSTSTTINDSYALHFGLAPKNEQILKFKQVSLKQQLGQQTRQEIKDMFSLGTVEPMDKEQQEEVQQAQTNLSEIYILTPECKKQKQISIDSNIFFATKKFIQNKDLLFKSLSSENKPLDLAKSLTDSYFDHVFIENNGEEKIENFRQMIINHSVAHLQRSQQDEKGRGFTNCKILILCPFMGDARAILDIIQSKFPQYAVNNKEKLDQIDEQNDFFRIGIKIARKKQLLTYFSSFDHSQIIIASPVGLKSIIGSEGDQKRENSFISSVQILYIDRASVFLMQNWTHLLEIMKNLNFMPKYESLKNSIDTIRQSFLELKGRLYRQSIVFSEFNFPQLNALSANQFHNIQGTATSKMHYVKPPRENLTIEQNFYKIEVKQPKDDLQIRFEYFKRKFWDDIHNKESLTKVIIFTNSYFEFVKLKSFLEKVNASAQYICQHTPQNKVQARLARFNNGQHRILLTTERAYYFQICQVKKFHNIYFYSLPRNNFIYEDLLSNISTDEGGINNHIISIYTKYDMLILQKIVGTTKALEMVREYCNNVSFVI